MTTDIIHENTRTSGRHPINVGHLVMGIAFLGLVGVWAAIESGLIEGGDIRWLLPVPWVLAGVAGLLAIALGGHRHAAVIEQPGHLPGDPGPEPGDQADHQPGHQAYAVPYSTPTDTEPPTETEDTTVIHTEQEEEGSR